MLVAISMLVGICNPDHTFMPCNLDFPSSLNRLRFEDLVLFCGQTHEILEAFGFKDDAV
jgi:hypothetical protein